MTEEEEAVKVAKRMTARVKAMCLECPNKNHPYSDVCCEHCVVYSTCWTEQDEDEKVLQGVQILEEPPE